MEKVLNIDLNKLSIQVFESQQQTAQKNQIRQMQPRRPDSAKSRVTQKTLDTELNQSKFSQTFTSYTTLQLQKKDEFLKYMQEKQKDPKFKKFLQPLLPEIPQKAPKQQLAKINSKPFEKRSSKVASSKPKVQQSLKQTSKQSNITCKPDLETSSSKWTFTQAQLANGTKKQNKQEFNSSRSFAQKNKQKMNSITVGLKKVQNQQKKGYKKIEFKGFKINAPGKKDNTNPIKVNQEQKQPGNEFITLQNGPKSSSPQDHLQPKQQKKIKPQKTEQQLKRQQELLQISRFINEVEMKNIDYYPEGYEEFVERNESQLPENLEMININDFLIEPTENDYEKIQRKIKKNEKILIEEQNLAESRMSFISSNNQSSVNHSTEQTSIDLDKIIDGDSQSQAQAENNDQSNIFLSSISSKDLKERNLFLTQVLKGRITKDDITKLQEMDRSQLKLRKLDEQPQEDDEIQIVEINMMKKKSNRLFERNLVEASGQIYRDCDYLSQENKLRLEKLLNGEMDPSPFEISEWERFAMRRIDEGIRLYRQLSNSSTSMGLQVIPQQLLPKDPNLRKQAQRKLLKQKIESINSRLQQIDSIVISQTKIQALIEEHRTGRIAQFTQVVIDERQRQIQELEQKSREAAQLLGQAQKEKAQIEHVLREMEQSYKEYQRQCKEFQKLSIQQIAEREKEQIKQKKKRIQEISKSWMQIETGSEQSIIQFHSELESQIQILRQIENLSIVNQMVYQGLELDLNEQTLDAKFEKKASEDPQLLDLKKKIHNNLQLKQNLNYI